jgi:hypothetical protein
VLEEAVATADRVVFDDADWNRDPPEDPPDDAEGEPPEDLEGQGGGAQGSCPLEREVVALWDHANPSEDPAGAAEDRSVSPTSQSFEVDNRTRALGYALEAANMTGQLSASIHPQEDPTSAPFETEKRRTTPGNVSEEGTIPSSELSEGPWTAELDRAANYDELTFVVIAFSCQEEAA